MALGEPFVTATWKVPGKGQQSCVELGQPRLICGYVRPALCLVAMPKYSIEIRDDRPEQPDAFEAPDFEHALAMLVGVAGESLIGQSQGKVGDPLFWNFDLMDERGLILYSLSIQGFQSAAMGRLR